MTTEYSGSGDPARSLALLWRTRDGRPGRTGRSGLSVDRIVATAIELADADGLPALSMRRVAERLGVGTMSLYTYVPGKPELIDVMLDTVTGELPLPSQGGTQDGDGAQGGGEGWRARLERIARDNWDLYHRHPWLLEIATARPPIGPNISARYEHELRAVDGIGLTDLEMDSVVSLLAGHVTSAARRSVEAAQVERRTGMTDAQWWAVTAPILERVMDGSRYPVAGRVGAAAGEAYGAASDPARAFAFGLRCILDGVEALVSARGTASGP